MEQNHIVRGILIGGSLGVMIALLGVVELREGFALGMIGGFFAGLTRSRRAARKSAPAQPAKTSEERPPSTPDDGDSQ